MPVQVINNFTRPDKEQQIMAWEDFWWDITKEIEELGIRKQFDKQLKKMDMQDEHKYRDTRDRWSYALDKVKKRLYAKQNGKTTRKDGNNKS